jgi:hypothetical protein
MPKIAADGSGEYDFSHLKKQPAFALRSVAVNEISRVSGWHQRGGLRRRALLQSGSDSGDAGLARSDVDFADDVDADDDVDVDAESGAIANGGSSRALLSGSDNWTPPTDALTIGVHVVFDLAMDFKITGKLPDVFINLYSDSRQFVYVRAASATLTPSNQFVKLDAKAFLFNEQRVISSMMDIKGDIDALKLSFGGRSGINLVSSILGEFADHIVYETLHYIRHYTYITFITHFRIIGGLNKPILRKSAAFKAGAKAKADAEAAAGLSTDKVSVNFKHSLSSFSTAASLINMRMSQPGFAFEIPKMDVIVVDDADRTTMRLSVGPLSWTEADDNTKCNPNLSPVANPGRCVFGVKDSPCVCKKRTIDGFENVFKLVVDDDPEAAGVLISNMVGGGYVAATLKLDPAVTPAVSPSSPSPFVMSVELEGTSEGMRAKMEEERKMSTVVPYGGGKGKNMKDENAGESGLQSVELRGVKRNSRELSVGSALGVHWRGMPIIVSGALPEMAFDVVYVDDDGDNDNGHTDLVFVCSECFRGVLL